MIYESCNKCSGRGGFDCSCSCSICAGKGTIQQTCSTCDGNARIACSPCSGSGRIVISKNWLFGEKYGSCSRCTGSGEIQCKTCKNGYVQTSCTACGRTGAKPNCPTCKGKKRIACSSCGGRGNVRPAWSKERIRAEIEQRRAAMRDEQEALEYWYEEYKNKPYLYEDGFPGRGNERAVSQLRDEISELVSWL
jgi:hypothetical protein